MFHHSGQQSVVLTTSWWWQNKATQISYGEVYSKKLNTVEGKEKYCVGVSNMLAGLEDFNAGVKINSAWEMIRENITISAKESPGYYELKRHKPWSDEGCTKLLAERKPS
jgi:hypothetical protein